MDKVFVLSIVTSARNQLRVVTEPIGVIFAIDDAEFLRKLGVRPINVMLYKHEGGMELKVSIDTLLARFGYLPASIKHAKEYIVDVTITQPAI